MILYPTIELQNGRCVSLIRGRIEEPELWHVDPLKKVQEFVALGAEWIHVTDLDAVKGLNTNRALLTQIIKTAGVPVQLGGGFRSAARVDEWFALGAERIVIGTLGVQMPTVVKELVARHPGKIALAVDVWKGKVLVDGWRTSSAYTPEGLIEAYGATPFAAIIVTDVDADTAGTEASYSMLATLSDLVKVPVIASGAVRTVDDVARLKFASHIAGALVGRALFNRTIDLTEALAEARGDLGVVAEFI
jgi:phosphoribosylformimino-5-aminoimidazole carboxamide ribotide isomerase